MRVWSRELSSTEISDLYSTPGTFANGSNLKGWWKFENAYTDSSGNGNTLTGVNSPVFATDPAFTGGGAGSASDNYTYSETDYANPHAPTAFFNGSATTTYRYDFNGNLASTTGAATSTYTWDYRNRMLSAWVSGATTTCAYDHTIARMAQRTSSTTSHYPNKFYSIDYAGTSTTTATSTAYIWHGDTLVAYIEQQIANGQATGTPTTYYVHPDHLGGTNVVTNASGTPVETLDYYPYGQERIKSGPADLDRTFIGQFGDDATALSYLNARYYEGSRGQFTSQDPVFWEVGQSQDGKSALINPQTQNSYSYAGGNPMGKKDPDGRFTITASYNANVEGGLNAYNASYVSTNVSIVVNPATRQAWLVRSNSTALTSGTVSSYQSLHENGAVPFVIGLYGGYGGSVGVSPKQSNPGNVGDVQVETAINVNAPGFSFTASGEETGTPTYSFAGGPKGVASVSKYPVGTQVTGVYSVNQFANGVRTQVSNAYNTALSRIQSQLKDIQSKLKELSRDKKQ